MMLHMLIAKIWPGELFSDKVLKDKAFEIALNSKYDQYQIGLASMVYKPFDNKRESGVIATGKTGASVNEVLDQELHKLAIKKFKRTNVYERFKDNIWAADLA